MRNLVKYNPNSFDVIGNFDRMFDSLINDSAFVRKSSPRVDISENADGYVLEAELPGFTEKDVEVKVDDNLLTISSKKEEEKKEEDNGYILRERRHESFARSFVLPKDVDKSAIEARFANGLLSLTLNKAPETKPKTIEINSAK